MAARSAWIDAEPAPAAAARGRPGPTGRFYIKATATRYKGAAVGPEAAALRPLLHAPADLVANIAEGGKPLVFSSSMAIVLAASEARSPQVNRHTSLVVSVTRKMCKLWILHLEALSLFLYAFASTTPSLVVISGSRAGRCRRPCPRTRSVGSSLPG